MFTFKCHPCCSWHLTNTKTSVCHDLSTLVDSVHPNKPFSYTHVKLFLWWLEWIELNLHLVHYLIDVSELDNISVWSIHNAEIIFIFTWQTWAKYPDLPHKKTILDCFLSGFSFSNLAFTVHGFSLFTSCLTFGWFHWKHTMSIHVSCKSWIV